MVLDTSDIASSPSCGATDNVAEHDRAVICLSMDSVKEVANFVCAQGAQAVGGVGKIFADIVALIATNVTNRSGTAN